MTDLPPVSYPREHMQTTHERTQTMRELTRTLIRLPIFMYVIGLGDPLNVLRLLVITTKGRHSGQPRHTALEYRRHGSKIYVISTHDDAAQWYKNLLDYPYATLRLGSRRVRAAAATVTDSGEALRAINLFHRAPPILFDPVLAKSANPKQPDSRTLPDLSQQLTIVRLDPTLEARELPYLEASYGWALAVATILSLSAAVIFLLVSLTRVRTDAARVRRALRDS